MPIANYLRGQVAEMRLMHVRRSLVQTPPYETTSVICVLKSEQVWTLGTERLLSLIAKLCTFYK